MKSSSSEAKRLITKVVENLEKACAISQGQEAGSILDFNNFVTYTSYWCDELQNFTRAAKQDPNEDNGWLTEESYGKESIEKNIFILQDEINEVLKYFKGEIEGSLGETLIVISYRLKQAQAVQRSISNYAWRQK